MMGNTIPHRVDMTYDGAIVMLRPASPGTGVIAGKVVRSLLESAGIKDVLTKSLGSNNASNVAKATLTALKSLRKKAEVFAVRGLAVPQATSSQSVEDTKESGESAEPAAEAEIKEPATESASAVVKPTASDAATEIAASAKIPEPAVEVLTTTESSASTSAESVSPTSLKPGEELRSTVASKAAAQSEENSSTEPTETPAEPKLVSEDHKSATE